MIIYVGDSTIEHLRRKELKLALLVVLLAYGLLSGKIKKLEKMMDDIRELYLLIAVFVLRLGTALPAFFLKNYSMGFIKFCCVINVIAIICILAFMCYNIHIKGMPIVAFGTALNASVIIANGGRMPVDISKINFALQHNVVDSIVSGFNLRYVKMTNISPLSFLGDNIKLSDIKYLNSIMSIGDIIIYIGLVVTVISYYVKEVEN